MIQARNVFWENLDCTNILLVAANWITFQAWDCSIDKLKIVFENDMLIYINHLENLEKAWKSRFCDLQGMVVPDCIISPFECALS